MSAIKRIHWADLARGVAALGVIAFHTDVPGTRQLYVFVDFFFVLSGFVLSRGIGRITGVADWGRFMLKRLFRFMPLVWMAVALKLGLTLAGTLMGKPCGEHECQPVLVISAALLLQVFIPATFMVLGPLWSLSVELFVNAGYALPLGNRKVITYIGVAIGLVMIVTSYSVPLLGPEMFNNYRGFSRGVLAFGLGLAIRFLPTLQKAWRVIAPSLVFSVVVLAFNFGQYQSLISAFVFALLIWGLSNLAQESTNPVYVRLATLMGNASFGIYVWHGAIRGAVMKLASILHFQSNTVPYSLFYFSVVSVIAIALALFTFRYVEQPIMNWFSKKYSSR